jgi:p-hydroxybenzoate 3-monooxygenase
VTGIAGRTQVGIVGAGPAGLVLAHMLHRQGIETVVLEARTREYIEQRVRAGVLENATVDLLTAIGLGDRLRREGIVHDSFAFRFDRRDHRITLSALTGGRRMTVYGQEELTKDLVRARLDIGDPLVFEAEVLGVDAIETSRPTV